MLVSSPVSTSLRSAMTSECPFIRSAYDNVGGPAKGDERGRAAFGEPGPLRAPAMLLHELLQPGLARTAIGPRAAVASDGLDGIDSLRNEPFHAGIGHCMTDANDHGRRVSS